VKIATFNVNGINGRLPVLLRWLAEAAPDVVCLQELKAPQERFPAAALRDAGYGAIWHGQKSWNGVAILARGANPTETGCPLSSSSWLSSPWQYSFLWRPVAATGCLEFLDPPFAVLLTPTSSVRSRS
jgi:exonuclease III